ncbi:Myotubularin-related protein 10 [Amphibalanus amphitrite]|uniref:Myotubularin-related protein 10 n=1 Tax=Amphibalanus amphitrite TaxID=1232801 RepID=A0A6A4VP57_AMPAM|nr:myotubularin-related protein 10-like [Amphibalanus amphitrite]KAF0292492.1 Myotubularin-related protein 10 [Amphibalanus amphitrite]
MAKSKPSRNFQSYIELDDGIGNGVTHPLEVAPPPEPVLLPGESVVATADDVCLYVPMSEQRQALFGRLVVTNFKLSFVTLHGTSGGTEELWRNRLLGKHDVCLMNVDAIYQVSSSGKRKLLAPRSNVSGRVKELQIRCKDFRVLTFSFRCSRLDEDRAITNALLVHCYPRRAQLMFHFDYKGESPEPGPDGGEGQCCSEASWTDMLTRTSSVGWRISHVNQAYRMCDSLPEVLVVPNGILDSQLLAVSRHYVGCRPPIWCWGSPDGGAIARAAYTHVTGRTSQEAQLVMDSIKSSHPTYKDAVQMDVGALCPSIDEVQESYVRLREICSPESVRALGETDGRSLGLLGASRWPLAVSQCLSAAAQCVQTLTDQQTVVVLTGPTGRDLTAAVASLAQLLVDAECRTLAGFQRLVQRQWVALGHPFQDRLGLIHRDGAKKSPVFLLFLDCVHQLLVQFPARFEFTETLLVSLWDSLHVSVFDTFLFNSEKERADASSVKENDYPLRRRPVWNWAEQFDPDWRKLFTSAAHEVKLQLGLVQTPPTPAGRGPVGPGLGLLAAVTGGGSGPPKPPPRRARRRADQLRPVTSVAAVRLWTLCFCRWVPTLDVGGGGRPAEEACLRHLLAQLRTLEAQVESARDGVGVRRSVRASAARGSVAPAPLPGAFHPFAACRAPTPLLSVTPGLVNALVRNSIITGEDGSLAAHRGRQYGL